MTPGDWTALLGQAADEGIDMVQFLGGEPTMAPSFTRIMSRALDAGLDVEVYSNLVHVTAEMWDLFQRPRVNLAFSYYARNPEAHNAVTQRPTHALTRRNAEKAVALGIPIRAGVIDFGHAREAQDDLRSMGITKIATDRVRGVGRGGDGTPAPGELCGHCGQGTAAVSADGDVSPCIFARWLRAGNVREKPLADILNGPEWAAALAAAPPGQGPVRPERGMPSRLSAVVLRSPELAFRYEDRTGRGPARPHRDAGRSRFVCGAFPARVHLRLHRDRP